MTRFVDDESKSKRGGREMDISAWPRFNYANLPHQDNGFDCGESCKYVGVEIQHTDTARQYSTAGD